MLRILSLFLASPHDDVVTFFHFLARFMRSTALITKKDYFERITFYVQSRINPDRDWTNRVTFDVFEYFEERQIVIVVHVHDWRIWIPGMRAHLTNGLRAFLNPYVVVGLSLDVEVRP